MRFNSICFFNLRVIGSNDEIISVANSIPFYWDQPFEELLEEGWDWGLEQGIRDEQGGTWT